PSTFPFDAVPALTGPQNVAPALQQQAIDLERARVGNSLAKGLERRPSVEALVEHNILKGPAAHGVAASLQSVQGQLAKKMVEDKLESSLQKRPSQTDSKLASSLVSNALAFEKAQLENHLSNSLKERPSKDELIGHNILKQEVNLAPSLQANAAELKRRQIADEVDHNVKEKLHDLKAKGVLAGGKFP
ncbi:MAG: hypothetical protein BJ554DRAFT_4319, partial [Olpidium bornovanus]